MKQQNVVLKYEDWIEAPTPSIGDSFKRQVTLSDYSDSNIKTCKTPESLSAKRKSRKNSQCVAKMPIISQ